MDREAVELLELTVKDNRVLAKYQEKASCHISQVVRRIFAGHVTGGRPVKKMPSSNSLRMKKINVDFDEIQKAMEDVVRIVSTISSIWRQGR